MNVSTNEGHTPLHHAAKYGGSAEVVSKLIESGADAFAKNKDGANALELAKGEAVKNVLRLAMRGKSGSGNN